MKVYLDDERPCPEGWTLARTPEEVLDLLKVNQVEIISLDHDLGVYSRKTGYDLVKMMIEQQVFPTQEIWIHTANPVGEANMWKALVHGQQREFDWDPGRTLVPKHLILDVKRCFSADLMHLGMCSTPTCWFDASKELPTGNLCRPCWEHKTGQDKLE